MANPARAQLSDLPLYGIRPETFANVDPSIKQAALNEASDRLDGYLPSHFKLPLTAPYPSDIISFECIVASYTLLSNIGYDPEGNDTVILKVYEQKIAWAEAVAKGEITPRITGGAVSAGSGDSPIEGAFVVTSSPRGYSERGIAQSIPQPNADPFTGD